MVVGGGNIAGITSPSPGTRAMSDGSIESAGLVALCGYPLIPSGHFLPGPVYVYSSSRERSPRRYSLGPSATVHARVGS